MSMLFGARVDASTCKDDEGIGDVDLFDLGPIRNPAVRLDGDPKACFTATSLATWSRHNLNQSRRPEQPNTRRPLTNEEIREVHALAGDPIKPGELEKLDKRPKDDASVKMPQPSESDVRAFTDRAPKLSATIDAAARSLPGESARSHVVDRLPGGKLPGATADEAFAHTRAFLEAPSTSTAIRTIEGALRSLKQPRPMDAETIKLTREVFSGDDGPMGFAKTDADCVLTAKRADELRQAVDAQTHAFPTRVVDRLPGGSRAGATLADALRHTQQLLETRSVSEMLNDVRQVIRRAKLAAPSGLDVADVELIKMMLHVEHSEELAPFSAALRAAKTGDDLMRVVDAHEAALCAHFKGVVSNLVEGVPDKVRTKAQKFISLIQEGKPVSAERALDNAHEYLKASGSLELGSLRGAIHALAGQRAPRGAAAAAPAATAPPRGGGMVQYDDLDAIFREVDQVLRDGGEGEAPPTAAPFIEDAAYSIRIFKAVELVMSRE